MDPQKDNVNYENIERPYDAILSRSPVISDNGSVQDATVRSDGAMSDVWIKNQIRSENWKPKSVGFRIDGQTGYAEFSNVFISGDIQALTGTIGGFTINATNLSVTAGGNSTVISSGTTAFSAGPTGSPTVTITQAGALTATSGAIGGWTISANRLSSGAGAATVGFDNTVTAGDDIRIFAGSATMASAPFSVTEAGVLTAASGVIGGTTITSTALTGGIIRTAASGARVNINSSNNRIDIYNSAGTNIGWFGGAGANGNFINVSQTNTSEDFPPIYVTSAQASNVIYGINTNSTIANRPAFLFTSNNTASETFAVANTGAYVAGNFTANGTTFPTLYITNTGAYIAGYFTSDSTVDVKATLKSVNTGSGGFAFETEGHHLINGDYRVYHRFNSTYWHVNSSGYIMWNDSTNDNYVATSSGSTTTAGAAAGSVNLKINGTNYNILYK